MIGEEKPFATLDDINAIILVADENGSIVFANKAIEEIIGYTVPEVLGNGWWELTGCEQDTAYRKEKVKDMVRGKSGLEGRHLFENSLITKDNREIWTQWTNTLTSDGLLVGIGQDITEKKILEEQLIKKNEENELLLKEIHHRVKNNLQVISSFLNLQFNRIDDSRVDYALTKSKNRIKSMSIIHTMLCESKSLATANFSNYISQLTTSIASSYSNNLDINCSVKPSKVSFGIDLSIILGLIITELTTNAYKHAFAGKTEGEISIEISDNTDGYELYIADNGIGITNCETLNGSLGLEIVNDLVEQINGTMNVDSCNGLTYTIKFPDGYIS